MFGWVDDALVDGCTRVDGCTDCVNVGGVGFGRLEILYLHGLVGGWVNGCKERFILRAQ